MLYMCRKSLTTITNNQNDYNLVTPGCNGGEISNCDHFEGQ